MEPIQSLEEGDGDGGGRDIVSAIPFKRPDHRTYLGGYDAGAILNIHRFRTGEQVVLEKLGKSEPKDTTYRMDRGSTLEPLMVKWYTEHSGATVTYPVEFIRHPKHEFLGGHPDALALGNGTGRLRLVECKLTTRRSEYGAEGTDEVPDDVYCQVQHYAMLLREALAPSGVDLDPIAHVVADLGDEQPKVFELPMVDEQLDFLRDAEVEFWNDFVAQGKLPPPANAAEARARWPRETMPVAHATDANVIDHAEVLRLQAEIKSTKTSLEEAKLRIMRSMAECGTLMLDDEILARWSHVSSNRFDARAFRQANPELAEQYMKASETRRFTLKERRSNAK